MTTVPLWINRIRRTALSAVLAAGLLGGPWAAVSPVAAVQPATPTAGVFVVNSADDNTTVDEFLTLREAMMVANGTLTNGFTTGEQSQLAGCTFNFGGDITGGCGAGVVDIITFSGSLGNQPVINLAAAWPLPDINDTASTIIDGFAGFAFPILNASAIGSGNNGLNITSDNNTLRGLLIVNSPQDGIYITGNHNSVVLETSVRNSGRNGIYIDGGDYNSIDFVTIGLVGLSDSGCPAGNAQNGVVLAGGATYNTITASAIGCSGQAGVSVSGGSTTHHNTIGPGNSIGTNISGTAVLSNTTGVLLDSGTQFNDVITNTIGRNTGSGVKIKGTNTYYNSVRANFIAYQGGAGLSLEAGASNNQIGAPLFGDPAQGNTISLNTLDGIYITGADTYANSVFNNQIGTDSTGTLDRGNGGNGVVVTDGAHGNAIGQQTTEANIISGNDRAGVELTVGAYDNYVQGNRIGTNRAGNAALPNGTGVYLRSGAHDNFIGSPLGTAYLNLIAGNTGDGVAISDSNTTTNTVAYNDIGVNSLLPPASAVGLLPPGPRGLQATTTLGPQGLGLPNGGDGLSLVAGPHHNRIGPDNYVAYNTQNGIVLGKGPHDNWVASNSVFRNQGYGLLLDLASSNVISRTEIFANGLDGIGEADGSANNWWTQMSIYSNGGLGIDKAVTSETGNTVTGPTPVITSTALAGGNVTIRGTATLSGTLFNEVEVYEMAGDPSGSGEGRLYLGTASVGLDGTWSLTIPALGLSGCFTTFKLDTFFFIDVVAEASEFGRNYGGCQLYLPLVRRP